jgi:ATP-dependent DNA helicase DinG
MRLAEEMPELAGVDPGRPNPTEAFLRLIRRQVLARLEGDDELPRGTHETDLFPALEELPEVALTLARGLARLAEPLIALRTRLAARLDEEADDMDAATRNRIEATCRSLGRRAIDPLSAWQAMLRAAAAPPPELGRLPVHVHFLRLDRRDAGDRDVGMHRHWLDPTVPFARVLAAPAHGLLVTSATLRDAGGDDPEAAWLAAEERVGAPHLLMPAIRASVASPFDYAAQTRCFVVTDIASGDPASLAAAYRALFLASGGGGLGLFTAINRLRAVHARIAPALEAAGIPLFAQHVDLMDNAGGHFPHRGRQLPAGNRCDARRRGRAGPRAAAGGVRESALAPPRHPAPRAAHASVGRRSQNLR